MNAWLTTGTQTSNIPTGSHDTHFENPTGLGYDCLMVSLMEQKMDQLVSWIGLFDGTLDGTTDGANDGGALG